MWSKAATGDDADEADGDHLARGDSADPRGLSLPGPPVCGAPADVPESGGRCAGAAGFYFWPGYRAPGGTTTPEGASDSR